MKFIRALAVLLSAIIIIAVCLTLIPFLMSVITVIIMAAFIVFVVKGVYEILKD